MRMMRSLPRAANSKFEVHFKWLKIMANISYVPEAVSLHFYGSMCLFI